MGMDWNAAFLQTLGDGLGTLRARNLYTDITICVEGVSYRCHKAVLCSLSPYFNSMFSSNMRESRSKRVNLPPTFINCKTFEILMDFFYSGKDVVTPDNAEDVLRAASFMQIQCLQDRCEEVLMDTITDVNCIQIWHLAKLYSYPQLEKKAWNVILIQFPTVAHAESFTALDVDELMSILEADELVAPTEGLVCDAVVKWLEADIDTRKPFLARVLGCLKLKLTSSYYLSRLSARFPFLEADTEGSKILSEARQYQMLPARQGDLFSTCTKYRKNSEIEDTIIVIRGRVDSTPHKGVSDVRCFSHSERKWYKLASLSVGLGNKSASCTYGRNKMFESGGTYGLRRTAVYNGYTNTWTMAGVMNDGRHGHVMSAVGDSLYVLGGANQSGLVSSIERCNIEEGKYEKVGKLQKDCTLASTAVNGESILVFGGMHGNVRTQSVQSFDTVTQTTTEICCMPHGHGGPVKSVGCDDSIFTITPVGSLLKLIRLHDGSSESHKMVQVHKIDQFYKYTPRLYFCAVAGEDGKIIVLGGQCSSCLMDDMMVISTESGEVVDKLTMPFLLNNALSGRLAVRREHLRTYLSISQNMLND
jgi:hypothetical protein